jgi:repressor LexA
MKELTDRQAQVFQYIVKYRQERGIPPTFREIAKHFGVSHQNVQHLVAFIRKKGLLVWEVGKARTLKAVI